MFITNNKDHFTCYSDHPVKVKLLNGSTASASGFGLKLIQCSTTKVILPLWPTYYLPDNPQCTFSPTALKHYLSLKEVITNHLDSLRITTSTGVRLSFPSIKQQRNGQLLDYHTFRIVRPISYINRLCPPDPSVAIRPPIASQGTIIPLTRNLCHQRLSHGCDDSLDQACRLQSILGLPTRPFPRRTQPCNICTTTNFTHPPKAKTTSTVLTHRGQLLHMDFSFWNITSIRGFTSLLSIIDGKERFLWNFPTASKLPPLFIVEYFLAQLKKENVSVTCIRIDEDGALARSTEFSSFIVSQNITLDTTGGYASWLNGKIERPHRTIASKVRAMLYNSGLSDEFWCYAAEGAADAYRYSFHSAI